MSEFYLNYGYLANFIAVNNSPINIYNCCVLFEIKLARRSIRSSGGLIRFTGFAAIVGIAVGVAGLIVVEAAARGFREELQVRLLASAPHIVVLDLQNERTDDIDSVIEKIRQQENVAEVEPAARSSGAIVGPEGTFYADIATSSSITERGMVEVGAELARKSGAAEGSEIELVGFREGSTPKTMKFNVRRIFASGLFERDSVEVLISPQGMADLYAEPHFSPSFLKINVIDPFRSNETAAILRKDVPTGLRVIDWQEANRPLFAAMRVEKKLAAMFVLLIVVIAALNITTTLAMLVNERRHDIAVLRSCGAKARTIVLVFLVKGLGLGIIGAGIGLAAGFGICFFANILGSIELPADVYMIDRLIFRTSVLDAVSIGGAAVLLSVAAAMYPAISATRRKPLEVFRDAV